MNPVYIYTPYLSYVLVVSSPLRLDLPWGLFPSDILTEILYAVLIFPIRVE